MYMILYDSSKCRQQLSLLHLNCVIYSACMAKKQAGTSLETAVMDRIQRIATVDRRSVAEVLAWCVELGLPRLEEELRERFGKLSDAPPLAGPGPVPEVDPKYKITGKRKRKAA
jgi:hypothetical protein